MDSTKKVIETAIESIDNKEFGLYFFTMDTQGNPSAGVANIYEHVKILRELGYNAQILHEKNSYTPVTWLGEEYTQLPHISAESNQLQVKPQDLIVVPEIYANVIEQVSKLPGYRVVMCQSYDYILEMLPPGKSWRDYGVTKCITTTEKQKEYINNLFSNTIDVSVVPVGIPDYFKPTNKDKKPIVSVMTRDQRDLVKIFKSFYLKYPHLKWITFRDMRGLPKEIFAKDLAESCLAVWVDDIAGFGTFPLEAMKSDVPVLAKVPNIIPEYFTDKNGLWTHDINTIPDLISNYVQAWLEDSEPSELYDEMSKVKDSYTISEMTEKIKEVYEGIFNGRKEELVKALEAEIGKETDENAEVIEIGDDNKKEEIKS
jgi:glycosyltransferase involved in cell wall biosynthesis